MRYALLSSAILLLLGYTHICQAYKGLFVTMVGTKSHLNFFGGIVEALSQNGHQITFVSPYKTNLVTENVTEIVLKENVNDILLGNPFELDESFFSKFIQHMPGACIKAFNDPGVQSALKEKYDYIILSIFFSECFLSYSYKNKIPHIFAQPNSIASPYSERMGSPEFTSVTPTRLLTYTFPFTFWQRIHITLFNIPVIVLTEYITTRTETLAREQNIWDIDTPSARELLREPSFVFINSVRALEVPVKSTSPNVIYAGGIHIKSPKVLPKDLSDWLDGSGEEGFIYFSLGTGIKAEHMKKEHLEILVEVFRALKQRILWKFDAEIENLPPNVMLRSWLPQQDILAHPKIRLFITHGGLFSCQEATYFEVPVLGMPAFMDQKMNVAEIVSQGWGRKIDWDELTQDKLKETILEVLTNSSLHERIHHRAILMRDWPRHPKEEVAYWVDYAVRYHGAKHLQSPVALLPWYEIYNVDVWVFIITTTVAILWILLRLVKFCLKLCMKIFFKVKRE